MTHAGTTPLTYEVFVAPPELTVLRDQRPGAQFLAWSPISATLITGERDAVLVDPLLTRTQAHALANWVDAGGKNLTAVYVTHGHGDHFFGLGIILDRFPEARGLATPAVVEYMRSQVQPDAVGSFWERLFPGQLPDRLDIAEPLDQPALDLEGHPLVAVASATPTPTTLRACTSPISAWSSRATPSTTMFTSTWPNRTPSAARNGSPHWTSSRR